MKERLTKAEAGDVFKLRRGPGKGTLENATVGPNCGANHRGNWYCATHRLHLENQSMKDVHIADGRHRLVWICHLHGPETP